MMTMKRIAEAIACALSIVLLSANAESQIRHPSVFSDYLKSQDTGNFLFVPGIEFSSSVGYTYFSGGNGSFGMGYYMGHFDLGLAKNLKLHWDVGVGTEMRQSGEYGRPELFIPNFDLTYRPSDKFFIRLQYQQYPWPGYNFYRR